jgi:hypothetical protein
MAVSKELAKAIDALASAEEQERAEAADVIFRAGRELALRATEKWWGEPELARLLLGEAREVTVGVAVGREKFARIRTGNGVARLAEVPSDQDAEEFELHFPEGVALDILTSRAPGGDGAIAKYLAKFEEGVQQVEFRCSDVDRATEILKEKIGAKAVYPEARPGADGTRVNFFLVAMPESREKVLIEVYERPSDA